LTDGAAQKPGQGEALRRLALFAAEADISCLPAEAAEKARACMLYAMAVGFAGMRIPQARQAAAAVGGRGEGKATRFFDDKKCDAADAAFANGTLFHGRVQDDAHPGGHVGVVVVPAALAVAEEAGASGADLLAAVVAGYEVALRIGRDHATDLSRRGFRTTPIYGVFGAAAAAGRLLDLDSARMTHALSLAANMAGGLREYSAAGTNEYPFQAGTGAANGILAARLAAAGATSAPTALDGAAGFFRAYGEAGHRYGAGLTEGLGTRFEMMAVTYKPYPACQFHRGIIRGAAALSARAKGAMPASISVRMHPFEADFYGVRHAGPFTAFPQTFMSAPFCAALAWARGDVTLAGLTDYNAPDVAALVARVEIVADAARQRFDPLILAKLADGSELEWRESEGAAAYALTWEAAKTMTEKLAAEVGAPPAQARRLVDTVSGLPRSPGPEAVVAALRAVCTAKRFP
jgi:2-methylcitrate dehydratase PrpD